MRLLSAFFLVLLSTAAAAEPSGGKPQADGSIAYESKFGSIVAKPDGTIELHVKGADHVALVNLRGLALRDVKFRRHGAMFATEANADGYVASAHYERSYVKSALECRDTYFERALKSPLKKENIVRSEQGDFAMGEYVTPEFRGKVINQLHRNIYVEADGYCFDLHLSKLFYDQARDKAQLDHWSVTAGVRRE